MLLLLTFMVDAWAQLPVHSNHTMMKNVLLLAMAACAIRQMWRGGDWSAFFNDFAPTGRVLLLVTHGGDRPGDRIPLAAGAQRLRDVRGVLHPVHRPARAVHRTRERGPHPGLPALARHAGPARHAQWTGSTAGL